MNYLSNQTYTYNPSTAPCGPLKQCLSVGYVKYCSSLYQISYILQTGNCWFWCECKTRHEMLTWFARGDGVEISLFSSATWADVTLEATVNNCCCDCAQWLNSNKKEATRGFIVIYTTPCNLGKREHLFYFWDRARHIQHRQKSIPKLIYSHVKRAIL